MYVCMYVYTFFIDRFVTLILGTEVLLISYNWNGVNTFFNSFGCQFISCNFAGW